MSMISELAQKLKQYVQYSNRTNQVWSEGMVEILKELSEKLQTVNEDGGWVPCEERMPEEHDAYISKWYGTDRWDSDTMWRKQSDYVLVTMELEDGSRKTEKMNTHDGKWFCDIRFLRFKVIAWRPLPEPYREAQDEAD